MALEYAEKMKNFDKEALFYKRRKQSEGIDEAMGLWEKADNK